MTGTPDDANPLRLKRGDGGAPDGSGRCVSCGVPLPANAVICVKCGFDKRAGRHLRTGRKAQARSQDGILWALLLLLIRIGLLAAIGYAVYAGYEYYLQAPTASPAAVRKICPTCRGQGKIKCPTCAGFGSIETSHRVKCVQCGGSGRHTSNLKKSATICPFCHGSGYGEGVEQVPCASCKTLGWTACAKCSGKGVIMALAPHP